MDDPVELRFPDGVLPEGWLSRYDSQPRVLPRFPDSEMMSLVVVICDDIRDPDNLNSVAYLVRTETGVDRVQEIHPREESEAICFHVPRKSLDKLLPAES